MFKIQQREQMEIITRAGLCLASKELKIASKISIVQMHSSLHAQKIYRDIIALL